MHLHKTCCFLESNPLCTTFRFALLGFWRGALRLLAIGMPATGFFVITILNGGSNAKIKNQKRCKKTL